MKTFTLILALILALSLVFNTDAKQQYPNDALRERLLDRLLEARREELLYNQRKRLEKQRQQYRENLVDDDDVDTSESDDSYERTHVRRKAVGLGDNPYK